jgi:hypothetical protein
MLLSHVIAEVWGGVKMPKIYKEKKGRYAICLDGELKQEWDEKFPDMPFSRRVEDMILADLLEFARRERKKCTCDYSRPRSRALYHSASCPRAKKEAPPAPPEEIKDKTVSAVEA